MQRHYTHLQQNVIHFVLNSPHGPWNCLVSPRLGLRISDIQNFFPRWSRAFKVMRSSNQSVCLSQCAPHNVRSSYQSVRASLWIYEKDRSRINGCYNHLASEALDQSYHPKMLSEMEASSLEIKNQQWGFWLQTGYFKTPSNLIFPPCLTPEGQCKTFHGWYIGFKSVLFQFEVRVSVFL